MIDPLIVFAATFAAGTLIGAALGHGVRTRTRPRRTRNHRIPVTTFRNGDPA